MSSLNKVYSIAVDIKNVEGKYSSYAKFFDDDRDTSIIKIKLLNDNYPIDLEGCTVEAEFILANNTYHDETCKIINTSEGIVELQLCQECLVAGKNTVRLSILKENEIANTPVITYEVKKGLYSDNPNFNDDPLTPVLSQMLLDVKVTKANQIELQERYEQSFPRIELKIKEVDEKIKEVNLAIASGTQDLEVKEARANKKGIVYAKLGDRLNEVDSQLEHIENDINIISDFTDDVLLQNSVNITLKKDSDLIIDNIQINSKKSFRLYGQSNVVLNKNKNNNFLFKFSNLDEVYIENINFNLQGGDVENHFLIFENIKKLTLVNCNIKNSFYSGCVLNNIDDLNVINCSFENNLGSALVIHSCEDITIDNIIFKNNGNDRSIRAGSSVYALDCKNVKIVNTTTYNTSDSALYVDRSRGTTIINNNTIHGCGKESIKVQYNTSKAIITNNIIDSSFLHGIACNFNSYETIIKGNHIYNSCLDKTNGRGSAYGAISITSSNNVVVNSNIIKGTLESETCGIYCSSTSTYGKCSNITITDNQVFYCTKSGIHIQDIDNVVCSDNILSQNCRNTSSWQSQLYIQNINGVVTNNVIDGSKKELWSGKFLDDNKFKLQNSSVTKSDFYNGSQITFLKGDYSNGTGLIKITRNIINYNPQTKTLTYDGDNIDYINDYCVKYEINNINFTQQYQVRLLGDNTKCVLSNNVIKKNNDKEYARNDMSGGILQPSFDNLKNYNLCYEI